MSDKHPENSLHRLLMDAYSGWKATQPKPFHIQGALTEVIGFIREMISHRQKRLGNLPERRSALLGNVRR